MRGKNSIFTKTIALVTLWVFLCSNVSFALRPQSAKDRLTTAAAPVSLKDALEERAGAFSVFSQFFRETLASVKEDPERLVGAFEEAINTETSHHPERSDVIRQRVLEKLACIAQDPGAPSNSPPECWYYIANYLYLRLEGNAINGICQSQSTQGRALRDRLEFLISAIRANVSRGRDLADPEVRKGISSALEQRFGRDDQALRGQVRFNYKSLLYRGGALYLSVDIMTGAEQNLADGVKSDLLFSIPVQPDATPEYQPPYQLGEVTVGPERRTISVSLFDPLNFLKKNYRGRAQEAGLVSEKVIYEAWQKEFKEAMAFIMQGKLKEGKAKLRVLLRISMRAGNAFEAARGFFRAIIRGVTVLVGHIVHTRSERGYANQTAITAPANIFAALFKEGMLGEVTWSFEADHNRSEGSDDIPYVKAVLDEIAKSGVHSGITIDATAFITKEGKTPKEKYKEAFEHIRWQLEYLQTALKAQEAREHGSVFFPDLKDWYVEVDLAIDRECHTPAEMRYIAEHTLRLRKKFGCAVSVVPGIGFEHGATAADVKEGLLKKLVEVARKKLGQLLGIGSHAGSGLGPHGLSLFRGQAWAINKSTEFGNLLLTVLRDSTVKSDTELYNRIWDTLFDEFKDKRDKKGNPVIPAEVVDTVITARTRGLNYERPYDYDYDPDKGTWCTTNERSKWLADNGREWIGFRDENGRLVFGNYLVWGISQEAWDTYAKEVDEIYRMYHGPDVMNGDGMLPAVEEQLRAKQAAAASQATAEVIAGTMRPAIPAPPFRPSSGPLSSI